MARLSLVFAGILLLVAVAAVTEASTVTTTTIEENARGSGSSCYQQVMDQGMLDQCTMYLMNNVKGGHQQGSRRRGSSGDEQMQMCCMQLENLGQECMCPGIKMMMNQPMWSTMGMGQMMGQMMSMAQNLPTQCGLMSQPCQMRAVWY